MADRAGCRCTCQAACWQTEAPQAHLWSLPGPPPIYSLSELTARQLSQRSQRLTPPRDGLRAWPWSQMTCCTHGQQGRLPTHMSVGWVTAVCQRACSFAGVYRGSSGVWQWQGSTKEAGGQGSQFFPWQHSGGHKEGPGDEQCSSRLGRPAPSVHMCSVHPPLVCAASLWSLLVAAAALCPPTR